MPISNRSIFVTAGIVGAIAVAFGIFNNQVIYFWAVLLLIAVFAIFWFRPFWALFLMALTFPFLQWQINVGSLNVPLSDLIGLLLLGVFGLKVISYKVSGISLKKEDFPGWQYFLAFVLVGALSLLNVQDEIGASFKYLLRPIIFFYAVYVLLPINFTDNIKQLIISIKGIITVGVILALGGVYTFLTSPLPFPGKNALPIGFGGFYPLGSNHNQLAEALVGVLPLAMIFFLTEKDLVKKSLWLTLAGFLAAVNFLTFSRAGWLSMVAIVFCWIYLRYRDEIKAKYLKGAISLAVLSLVPVLLLVYALSTSKIVQSSNYNRLRLADIAWTLFIQHPLIGNGVGTYYRSVEQIKAYIIEYGAALDAHGILFKVMPEMGILGVIAISLFFIYLFRKILDSYWKVEDPAYSAILAGLICSTVGMFVFEFFNTSYYQGKLWIFFGLTFATIKLWERKTSPSN